MITYTQKHGFTIVEVLITIGIIGVVAAITIPTLLKNTNNYKFATRFKKTVSTLAQGALTSQAQYDVDYSLISEDSANETCTTVALSKGNNSMCALFNNAFAAKSYRGVYGSVGGVLPGTHYSVRTFSEGFSPANYLIYTLSDGAMVGFNPSVKGCSLNPGTQLTNEMITGEGALANCLGFIDVNGISLPNREVACDTSSETALTPNASCKVEKANGDVFPIVFHNGTVEPATNAARAVMARGKSNAEPEQTPATTANGHKIGKRNDPSTWEAFAITTPLSESECNSIKADLGIQNCNEGGNDYWAAAVKECGGVDKMVSDKDLYALAKTIYRSCDDNYYSEGVGRCDGQANFSNLPESFSGLETSWRRLWSGSEYSSTLAHYRFFYSASTNMGTNGDLSYSRNSEIPRAICVTD